MACLVYLAVIFQLAVHCVRADPKITPARFQHIQIPANLTVVGSFLHPLVGCRIRISDHYSIDNFDKVLDFSHRRASEKVNLDFSVLGNLTANFEGRSPDECGVAFQTDTVWMSYPMLIEIFGQSEGGDWSRGWALVVMTYLKVIDHTSSTPLLMVAKPGSDVSVLLKTQGAMDSCGIKTPAEDVVELSPGKSLPPDSRYRVHGAGKAHGECGYTLTNLTARDSGVWMWYMGGGRSSAFQMTIVLISTAPLGKPVLSVHDASRLRVGDLMKATCRAPPGVPPPKLTWLLDGLVVRHDDGNATLPGDVAKSRPWQPQGAVQTFTRRLSSQDFGKRLDCRAEHSAGVDSVGVVLTLHPAYLTVTAESPLIHTAVGHLTELACIVEAGLTTTVQWRRAGVPVNPSRFVAIGNDGTRHWLQLEDVTLAEMTNFTCTASNELGSESKVIQLTGLPGTPKWKEGTSPPQLAWTVETVEELTSSKLKVRRGKARWQEHEVVDGMLRLNDSWVLVQHHLQVTIGGNYSAYLIARNVYGESPPSSSHMFALVASTPTSASIPAMSPAAACPALATASILAVCSLGGSRVNCSSASLPLGTTAELACREGYKPPDNIPNHLTTRCNRRGWHPKPLVCFLDCGHRKDNVRALSLGSQESLVSEFPWHVGVFKWDSRLGTYTLCCGGSLVSPKFFVSAAHCFWGQNVRQKLNETLYKAALGKHTLAWATSDEHEQRLDVSAIHLPSGFSGNTKRYEADIAVVKLSTPIRVTRAVNVVCIDWQTSNLLEDRLLVNHTMGVVTGFGITENDTQSSTLRFVNLPYVPMQDCELSVPADYHGYLLGDKICGGFTNLSTGVCPGDSGGGFVFPSKRHVGDRYYLRGVVSNSPDPWGPKRGRCQAEHPSLFTRISAYIDWVRGIVFAVDDEEEN